MLLLYSCSTKFSPMEKLEVFKTTFEKINEEVSPFWQGEKKLVSLDDLFPVFQFVVIRARTPADVESLTWDQRFISLTTWWTVMCTKENRVTCSPHSRRPFSRFKMKKDDSNAGTSCHLKHNRLLPVI